jgi:hypothetical protein
LYAHASSGILFSSSFNKKAFCRIKNALKRFENLLEKSFVFERYSYLVCFSFIQPKTKAMSILAKTLVRLYRLEDEEMQTRAQTMHANLLIDLALFTAKFPWLDTAYALSFQSDITTAVNFQLDNEVKDLIKVLT